MKIFRYLLPSVVAAVFAFGLVACGGGGGGDEDPQQVVDETFAPGKDYSSGIIDIVADITTTGDEEGSLKATVKGPFQSAEGQLPQFDLTADVDVAGSGQDFSFAGGLVSTGDKAFVNFQDTDYEVDASTLDNFRQLFLGIQKQSAQQPEGGTSVSESFTNLENEGTEDVEGVETIHVSGDADVDKLIASAQKSAGAQALPAGANLDELRQSVKESTLDIYSSTDDNRLQKLTAQVVFDPPAGTATGEDPINIDFSLAFSDLGEPQTVTAPTSAKPLSELLQRYGLDLGGALPGGVGGGGAGGGAGGGGAGGGAAAPVPTPPSGGASQEYLDCLSQARGQDAIQACAEGLQ